MSIVVVIAVLSNIFCVRFDLPGQARQEPCQKFSIPKVTRGFDRGKCKGATLSRCLNGNSSDLMRSYMRRRIFAEGFGA